MSVEKFTSEDWAKYNEGCKKVIEAIKTSKWYSKTDGKKVMAEISYPVDANGMYIFNIDQKYQSDYESREAWWDSYLERQDYRV